MEEVNGGQSLSKQRIGYVDLIRAVGIILMIMGHIQFSAPEVGFDKWIHSFHMPLFFVVSGYLFKPIDIKIRLYKRFRTLIVPYFFFGIVHIVISSVISKSFSTRIIYIFLYENTAGGGVPIAGALWFLTSLFISDILYALIDKVMPSRYILPASISIMISGLSIATFTTLPLPYGLSSALVGVGFIECGRLLKTKLRTVEDWPLAIAIVFIIIGSMLTIINDYINLRTGDYGIWPIFLMSALLMIIGIWIIAKRLNSKFVRSSFNIRWIYNIGESSIIFLCCNQLLILIISYIVRHCFLIDLYGDITPLIVIVKIIILILVIVLLSLISIVSKRKPFNIVLGK